jgi:hypothetical protein
MKMLYALIAYDKRSDAYSLYDDPAEALQDTLESADEADQSSHIIPFSLIRINTRSGKVSSVYDTKGLRMVMDDRADMRAENRRETMTDAEREDEDECTEADMRIAERLGK